MGVTRGLCLLQAAAVLARAPHNRVDWLVPCGQPPPPATRGAAAPVQRLDEVLLQAALGVEHHEVHDRLGHLRGGQGDGGGTTRVS